MATTLTFTLPSNPGCPPLVCGVGNLTFVKLLTDQKAKSADGSGYLRATITAVQQLSLTSWRYTVSVPDSEVADPVTGADVEPSLCCVSCADAAILAKLAQIDPSETTVRLNWQTISLRDPDQGVVIGDTYLFRRNVAFRIHAIEIAICSGAGPVDLTLQVSGGNNEIYVDLTSALTVSAPQLTARLDPEISLLVPAKCALRARVSHGGIYPSAYGLELHLLTSEI